MQKDDGLAKYYNYECESDKKKAKKGFKSLLLSLLPYSIVPVLLLLIAIPVTNYQNDVLNHIGVWSEYEYVNTECEQTVNYLAWSPATPLNETVENNFFVLFKAENGTVLKCQCTRSQFVNIDKSHKTGDYFLLQYRPNTKVVYTSDGQEFKLVTVKRET